MKHQEGKITAQRFTTSDSYEHEGYNPGHPWYYFLGGRPRRPREILEATRQSGYQGYACEDIKAADAMAEPKRSDTLRAMRARFMRELRHDLSRYRKCVNELRRTDWALPDRKKVALCEDLHTTISLKHNHLVYGFGHLIYLDELLSHQMDLFGF